MQLVKNHIEKYSNSNFQFAKGKPFAQPTLLTARHFASHITQNKPRVFDV